MDPPEHCWHTYAVAESYPEIYLQRCCCCGAERGTRRLPSQGLEGPEPEHEGPLPEGSVACQLNRKPAQ
jgi:hypothetical protein